MEPPEPAEAALPSEMPPLPDASLEPVAAPPVSAPAPFEPENLTPASNPSDVPDEDAELPEPEVSDPQAESELAPSDAEDTPDDSIPAAVAIEETPAPPVAPRAADPRALSRRERERILESPTQQVELYEKARRDHVWDSSRPDWSFNLGLAPRAFRNADLRVPLSQADNEGKPRLTGILLGGERVLMHSYGQLAVGGEFGMFGNTHRNRFSGLLSAIMTLGPYVQYEGQFFARQIVVPAVKAGYEVARINYSFSGNKVQDIRALPRLDLGLLIYLNFLEPRSAGLMQSNYGIKRTYLSAYYSLASDPSKKDIDLTERGAYRVGFRFEF